MGKAATAIERKGQPSELGSVNREIKSDNERRVVDLAAERSMREARAAARGQVDNIRPENSSSRTEPPRGRSRVGTELRRRGANHYAELRAAQAPAPPPKVRPEFVREAVGASKTAAAPTVPGQATTRATQARGAARANDMRRAGDTAAGGKAAAKTAGKASGILARSILGLFAFLQWFDLFPAKPPSPEQQRRNHQAAKEQQATDEIAAAREAVAVRQRREQNARQQEGARHRRERGRDDDGGRERER